MANKKFDPKNFIDNEFEQELFEELLQCRSEARILSVKDVGGNGKSNLLKKFRYRCRTGKPRIATSLVDLGELEQSSPLKLVQRMQKDLSAFINFSSFETIEKARNTFDLGTIGGSVDFQGANCQSAHIHSAGAMANVNQVNQLIMSTHSGKFNREQQSFAEEESVKAFFDDLMSYCQSHRVVLLLDDYNNCDSELKNWLIEYFIERHYFNIDNRSSKLLLVIAGREIPDFEFYWPKEDCDLVIRSVKGLSEWEKEHIEKCLRVYGCSNVDKKAVESFCYFLEQGAPKKELIDLIIRMANKWRK